MGQGFEHMAQRAEDVVAAAPNRKPFISKKGIGYRELNANELVLPKQANFVHFEQDEVTPTPAVFTPKEKVDFRFDKYDHVMEDWVNNVSDHCPVKVWF